VDNDLIPTNPAKGIKVADKRRAKDKRREFNKEELKALFSGPVHTDEARPVGGGGEAAYWLPLLALYTGARQTELGQFWTDDVYEESYLDEEDNEHSAWVMRFVDNEERGQNVKTDGSERRVPFFVFWPSGAPPSHCAGTQPRGVGRPRGAASELHRTRGAKRWDQGGVCVGRRPAMFSSRPFSMSGAIAIFRSRDDSRVPVRIMSPN